MALGPTTPGPLLSPKVPERVVQGAPWTLCINDACGVDSRRLPSRRMSMSVLIERWGMCAGAGCAGQPPRRVSGRDCRDRCGACRAPVSAAGGARVRRTVHAVVTRLATGDAVGSTVVRNAVSWSRLCRGRTGRAARWRRDPLRWRHFYAATRWTGMPSCLALSTRLSVMPLPGNAMTPLGSRLRSSSLRRKGAALP